MNGRSDTATMTGAQYVFSSGNQESDTVFAIPACPSYPFMTNCSKQIQDSAHSCAPRTRRRPTAGQGYLRSTGKAGLFWSPWPRRPNAVTHHRRAKYSIPLVVLTGQVADLHDRLGRVPRAEHTLASRASLHEDELAGPKETECCAAPSMRAFPHAPTSPGPFWWTFPRTCNRHRNLPTAAKPISSLFAKGSKATIDQINGCVEAMEKPSRPLFYTVRRSSTPSARPTNWLREFVAETNFPITSTLMGLGAYSASATTVWGCLGCTGL